MIKKVWKMFFSYFTIVNVFAQRNRSVFEEWPSQPFPFLKQLLKLVWDLLFHEELTYVPILAKLDCIHKYESEGKINMMVRKVIKVDYEPNKLWEPASCEPGESSTVPKNQASLTSKYQTLSIQISTSESLIIYSAKTFCARIWKWVIFQQDK